MIYKYCPPTVWSLGNLRSQHLFCQHFAGFNDPFEFWSRIFQGLPSPDEQERLRAVLAALGVPDTPPEDHEEYLRSLEDIEPPFQRLFDHMRIVCFASESANLLMWSHYAEGLRGFCLGFEESLLVSESEAGYLTDVEYLAAPPVLDAFVYAVASDQYDFHLQSIGERSRNDAYLGPDPVGDDEYRAVADEAVQTMRTIWRRAFAAKPAEWSYEREKRLLVHHAPGGNDPLLLPYPAAALSEIVLGEKMPAAFREELLGAVAAFPTPLRVMEAYRRIDSFTLALRRIA